MIRVLLSLLLLLCIQNTAFADDQRTATIQQLYELSQDFSSQKILPVRGGSKDKPLGVYLGTKEDIEFRSGYKNVEPRTQCEWAFDLNQFIVQNGGGWDNFKKYSKEAQPKTDATSLIDESLRSYAGAKDPKDPWERAHVPYDKQAAFAEQWWKKNSQAYNKSIVPPKDWWIHDAVLDGNNLWTRHQQLHGNATSDYIAWRDAELATLLKKH